MFQLYHATFPSAYLRQIHDKENIDQNTIGVTLTSTKLYDFCIPAQRAEWLDILIALIEYIRTGESEIGFVNKAMKKNMLHKSEEDAADVESQTIAKDITVDISGATQGRNVRGDDGLALEGSNTLRRSSRKRGLNIAETDSRDTKVRWKI